VYDGESTEGQIYKFCLDFHNFSKWHSGVYVEFSLLEMCWFDDFFLIWLAHMYSFFLSSVLHNSQAINYVLFNLIFIEQTIFSYYYNIPQVEEFFSCFLFALSLIINCMVIIVCIIIQFANAILHSRIYTLTQSIHKTHWDEIISEGAYFISYPLHNSFITFILRMLENWRILLWKRSWIKK